MSLIRWNYPAARKRWEGVAIGGCVLVLIYEHPAWVFVYFGDDYQDVVHVGLSVDDAKVWAEQWIVQQLRSAGWIPVSEATPVKDPVRFAAVDLPGEINRDRAQIEALGRRLTEEI